MNPIRPEKIRDLLPELDSEVFSPEVYRQAGIFVTRKAIPEQTVLLWQAEWQNFYSVKFAAGRKVNRFNPVAVDDALPPVLAAIHRNEELLDIVEQVFGPDLALYNQRLTIKDKYSRGPVFLHQDSPYHIGSLNKASAFVPLSQVTPENGGLIFYPGTHQFGYLGDAGEINPEIIDADWPTISPSLDPGDVMLMNSLIWHGSGPHVKGPDRIIVDTIYQPADDPSGNLLLRGSWRTEVFLNKSTIATRPLFRRSRVTRLSELQREVDELKSGGRFE